MEEKYFGFVYETTNLINGMKYIGKCIFSRQNGWKNYLGSGMYLKRAIEKYGKENFKREIIVLAMDAEELNELEEAIITISNAVESIEYYNLKHTAIGGDIFTHHPRKEEIREMRRNQFKGEGNYWYGKEKPQHIIDAIREGNSKKIWVNGDIYDSLTDCSNKTGVKINTISYRLKSEYRNDYLYIDEEGNPIQKEVKEKVPSRSVKVFVNGQWYDNMRQAHKSTGIAYKEISRLVKEGIYETK